MRNVLTSLAELAGAGSVSAGAFIANTAAGYIVSGLFLLAFARQASRR